MSGIFLAYSRADRALALTIVQRLRGLGVEVWWDEDMPGVDWQDELARKALELAGVMVLWTPNSIASRHVKDEARLARENDKLINVVCGVSQPPFPYDAVNGLPLDGWTGREPHNGWSRTVRTVEDQLVRLGAATPGQITGAESRRDADIRVRAAALATAQAALREAQDAEAGTADAATEAAAAFERAQAQHRSVVDQGLGPLVIEGARQELEAARAANDLARQAMRQAKGVLSHAAQAVAQASRDLETRIEGPEEIQPAPAAVAPPPARPDPPVESAPAPAPAQAPPAPAAVRASPAPAPAATGAPPVAPPSANPNAARLSLAAVPVVLVIGLLVVTVLRLGGHPNSAASSSVASDSAAAADSAASASAPDSSGSTGSSAADSSSAGEPALAASSPQDSVAEAKAAMAADNSGDYQAALKHWSAVLLSFPRGSVHAGLPLMGMALDFHHLGQQQTALSFASQAVDDFRQTNDENLPFALVARGAIEETLGQTGDAIADYRSALANNPSTEVATTANVRLRVLGAG